MLFQALIVPADEDREMVLVVWDADAPLARATSIVDTVLEYRFAVDDPVESFRGALETAAPNAVRIGFDAASRAVPHTFGRALTSALSPAGWVDCSVLLAEAPARDVPDRACLLDEGVVVGGTYAVTEVGCECLAGAGPVDLYEAGSG